MKFKFYFYIYMYTGYTYEYACTGNIYLCYNLQKLLVLINYRNYANLKSVWIQHTNVV